ncbi:MAG: hypothetical protein RXQ22_08785, partial [Sulfolobus sp.]
VFQKLEAENSLIYPLQVTVNADVEAKKVMEKVKEKLKDYLMIMSRKYSLQQKLAELMSSR